MRRILGVVIVLVIILCLAMVIFKIRVKDNKVEIEFRKPQEIHQLHKGFEKSLEGKVQKIKVKTMGTEKKKSKASQDDNEVTDDDRRKLEEIIEKAR